MTKPFRLITALLATMAFCATVEARLARTSSDTCTYNVPTHRRLILTSTLPRRDRSRPVEVSLSPPTLPVPVKPGSSNVTRNNNSSTSSTPQEMPSPPAWVLTVEDLITAVFRIVITVLTLFNVNITWRIRANQDRRRGGLGNAWAGVRFEIV